MFQSLGKVVSRAWPLVLVLWFGVAGGAGRFAPDWSSVTVDGEFVFLPKDSPSRIAEDLYRRAFPAVKEASIRDDAHAQQNPLSSTIVLIVQRTDQPGGLTGEDLDFIETTLRPELEEIARTTGPGYVSYTGEILANRGAEKNPLARGIWTWADPGIGALLTSEDHQATLVLMELKTEFLDRRNSLLIHRVEELVQQLEQQVRWQGHSIAGLKFALSGSAAVGRDMYTAEHASAANTEWFTKTLVIFLLLAIYRAPILALVPLLTVGMAVEVSIRLLRLMAEAGWIGIFRGIEIYVTVVVYGAGIDYCLFLIARYKEELGRGVRLSEAMATAMRHVGPALAASAATSMCGVGMMTFAEFGKFREAGFAIAFGLFVVLCAALTFTPALMLMAGRWAFWPHTHAEARVAASDRRARWRSLGNKVASGLLGRPTTVLVTSIAILCPLAVAGSISRGHLYHGLLCVALTFTPSLMLLAMQWAFFANRRTDTAVPEASRPSRRRRFSRLDEQHWLESLWQRIADKLLARPATILLTCTILMCPFAAAGLIFRGHLSYGLLSDLPQDDASVEGAKAVQNHFAAGIAGPTTVLLYSPQLEIPVGAEGSTQGEVFAAGLTESLGARAEELNIADIRSQKTPLGSTARAGTLSGPASRGVLRSQARRIYMSEQGDFAGDVVRLDLVFNKDPFSRGSIHQITQLEQALRDALPGAYFALLQSRWQDAQFDADFEPEHESVSLSDDVPVEAPVQELRAHAAALAAETQVWSLGPTASIRDVKDVTDRDQIRIYVLVVICIFLVMVALLGKPAICVYLILSVVFSYFVTLGVTSLVFWLRDPAMFTGLDWKVPIFLFTILIGMGVDYNILLMARIDEEQRVRPPVDSVIAALTKTGSIISSCGIIMAGTFSTLMTGSLLGMVELGFALGFGVLLDTFVVRPLLVPSYLILLHTGRFGRLGPWLGAKRSAEIHPGWLTGHSATAVETPT